MVVKTLPTFAGQEVRPRAAGTRLVFEGTAFTARLELSIPQTRRSTGSSHGRRKAKRVGRSAERTTCAARLDGREGGRAWSWEGCCPEYAHCDNRDYTAFERDTAYVGAWQGNFANDQGWTSLNVTGNLYQNIGNDYGEPVSIRDATVPWMNVTSTPTTWTILAARFVAPGPRATALR